MGEKTKLIIARKNSDSLRTTVPTGIAKQFNLKPKDQLLWEIKIIEGELKIVVSPIE